MNAETGFAARLKKFIEARGTTAAALSREAGLGDTFIKDILRGHTRSPRGDSLVKLATALEITMEELLGEDGPVAVRSGMAEPEATQWVPPQTSTGNLDFDAVLAMICPTAQRPSPMKVAIDMPGFLLARGDLIVIDLKRSAVQGEIVAVNYVDAAQGSGVTLLRRYVPPYLLPPGGELQAVPDLADGRVNAIMGPVIAAIRAGEM